MLAEVKERAQNVLNPKVAALNSAMGKKKKRTEEMIDSNVRQQRK